MTTSRKVRLSVIAAQTVIEPLLMRLSSDGTGAAITWSAWSRVFCVPVSMLDDVSSSTTGRKTGHAVDGFWRDLIARQGDFDRVPKDQELRRCSTTEDDALMPWLQKAESAKSLFQ